MYHLSNTFRRIFVVEPAMLTQNFHHRYSLKLLDMKYQIEV